MIGAALRGAYRLDHGLQDRLGRPYNAILAVMLVLEIVHRVMELPAKFNSPRGLVWIALELAVEAMLLIHQLGVLSHHIELRFGKPAA